ncbi:MAG: hypothetical protein C0600_07395 [Ignavibacteria bacterium]|nr:MAG: hypothetical protein C0600_07395 [Ignavibacteria bacterium]
MSKPLSILFVVILASALHAQQVERVYPDYDHSALFGVAVTDAGDFYAAGSNNTLIRSTDGGMIWEQLPMGEHRMHITHLTSDGNDVYFLAAPYETEGRPELWPDEYERQLFRFERQSMAVQHVPFPLLDTADIEFISDYDLAATSQALYLSYFGNRRRVLRSLDGGEHWQDLSFPDSLGFYITFHTVRGSDDILVYMRRSEGATLYLSSNAGETWAARECPKIQIGDPIQYLGDGRVLLQSFETGTFVISDSGDVWRDLGYPPFEKATCLGCGEDGTLFACSENGGIFCSQDNGTTWTTLRPDLQSNHLSVECEVFGTDGFIAADRYGRISITFDGGISWEESRMIQVMYGNPQMADAENGLLLGSKIDSHGLNYYFTNDGFRMLELCPPFRLYRPYMRTPQLWYSVGVEGYFGDSLLCRSEDGGYTWDLVLQMQDVKAKIIIPTADTNAIGLTTTHGLIYSPDRGESWSWIIEKEWDNSTKPQDIHIESSGKPIWMITHHDEPYHLLRSDGSWSVWDTVYVVPEDEIDDVWRIQSFTHLNDGGIYMLQVLGVSKPGPKRFRVLYSDDDGDTWQSWMATQDGHSTHGADRISILENGGMISSWRFFMRGALSPFILHFSMDGLVSEAVFYEHALVGNVDLSGYNIVAVDSTTAYLATGMGIYRITLPEVTNVQSPKPLPLPLSIGTPYPHPVSRAAESATLFLQSDRTAQVTMTVHDLAGREIGRLFEGALGPEGRYLNWSTHAVTPGTYLLQLASEKGVCRRKVIVE